MIFYVCSIFCILSSCANATNLNVFVNTTSPLHLVSDKFLGVTLDAYIKYASADWFGINITEMAPLSSALGSGYLRFGGTYADKLVFQANATEVIHIFTGKDLDYLYKFVQSAGWRLIFDLNQLLRSGSKWNSSDAQDFINYASSHGYYMDFELGNEPDLYERWNATLTGQQIAEGYNNLRALLTSNSLYKNSSIIGPSVAFGTSTKLVEDFLSNGGGNAINALTFHQYYFGGQSKTVEDYLNVTYWNGKFLKEIYAMKSLNHSPLWLSETAIDSCGCAVNLSNTFVAGFLWLDKLGLSALNGVQVVLRQALHGTFLGLLYNAKDKSVKTNPDYWLSFLYKKLVGNRVFEVTVQPNDDNLRLYAGSSKSNSDFVVYGLSLANYSISLALPQLTNNQVVVYIVKESEPGNLQSKTTKLNGEVMDWTSHEPIFNIKGNVTTLPIEIPPYSQFFISAAPTAQKQCPQGWYTESTLSNKCIKLVNHYTPPWFAANFDCTTFGINSTILSIENAFENSEITRLTAKTDCTQYYMGLYRNGSNWLWSNGDLSTYKNWKIGFPTNDLTKNCATFDAKTGDWSNMDCDSSQCYACQQYV